MLYLFFYVRLIQLLEHNNNNWFLVIHLKLSKHLYKAEQTLSSGCYRTGGNCTLYREIWWLAQNAYHIKEQLKARYPIGQENKRCSINHGFVLQKSNSSFSDPR